MNNYWNSGNNYSQPTEAVLKKNAGETKRKEKAKGKKLDSVIVSGRKIVNHWWGKAWCDNLESYADYESRLDRGKRYVRTGAVVDLQIKKGKIEARVQGSRKIPYKIEVRISPLSEEHCQEIIGRCSQKIENLHDLINGNFPEELKDAFLGVGGLFPEPKEISFNCSCPDWALLCKHVAAVLYGVGVRLDSNPLLFFELRGLEVNRFIDITLATKVETMLANVNCPSNRIITGDEAMSRFGVI